MQVRNDYLEMTDLINRQEKRIKELKFQVRQEKHKGEVNANALLTRVKELEAAIREYLQWRTDNGLPNSEVYMSRFKNLLEVKED